MIQSMRDYCVQEWKVFCHLPTAFSDYFHGGVKDLREMPWIGDKETYFRDWLAIQDGSKNFAMLPDGGDIIQFRKSYVPLNMGFEVAVAAYLGLKGGLRVVELANRVGFVAASLLGMLIRQSSCADVAKNVEYLARSIVGCAATVVPLVAQAASVAFSILPGRLAAKCHIAALNADYYIDTHIVKSSFCHEMRGEIYY